MIKKEIKQIIKKIPNDTFLAVRDMSLLSFSVLGKSHAITTKKKFGVGIFTFFAIKNNQANCYRSEKENEKFSRNLALKYKNNEKYAKKLANNLIELTDWFGQFIDKNETLADFRKNAKLFFDNYDEFFALHQGIYWGGDFLSKIEIDEKDKERVKRTIDTLNSAYKYNELVVPEVEKYFKNLCITDFLYKELIGKKEIKPKIRSLLFLNNGKCIVLSPEEADIIEKGIEEKQKASYQLIKEFKGLVVTKGVYNGKVKLIADLNNLKDVNPGDVLVTHMTRPQFNKQIKGAGAIVTNEGGVLCHAAMLAREFNIPCVVGTKIATKVLKDGDLVEVDADKGIVKIIKR